MSEEEIDKKIQDLIDKSERMMSTSTEFIGTNIKVSMCEDDKKVLLDLITLCIDLNRNYKKEKEKNKKLETHLKQYLDGELITAKQGKFFEKMIKENYIRKDKLKAIQGELCMQLGSYVRDEASPEQERIAGGINIINKILEGE